MRAWKALDLLSGPPSRRRLSSFPSLQHGLPPHPSHASTPKLLQVIEEKRILTICELSSVGLSSLELYGDDMSKRLLQKLDGD